MMAAEMLRPEDLLNEHLDHLLGGKPVAEAAGAAELAELDELLAVAGLLADALGTPAPRAAARAAGRDRFLAAARRTRSARADGVVAPDREHHVPQKVLAFMPRLHS